MLRIDAIPNTQVKCGGPGAGGKQQGVRDFWLNTKQPHTPGLRGPEERKGMIAEEALGRERCPEK